MSKLPKKHLGSISVALILIAIASIVSYNFGKKEVKILPITNEVAKEPTPASPLFQTQTATVVGKITKVDSGMLTVVDSNNKSDNFELSPKFVIYKPVPNSPKSTSSADLKEIITDQLVSVLLQYENGLYRVTSIAYFPEVAAIKISSPSASRP